MIIPIVMACDDKYAPALGVAVSSMCAQRKKSDTYAIHILYTSLSRPNIDRLEGLTCSSFSVQCIKIDLPSLPETRGWVSQETYYRLFAADLLANYDKILYLDCDIIVLSDLSLLYAQDLGDKLVGGVGDYRFDGKYAPAMIDVSTDNYINAGVLLINAGLWRTEKISKQCLAFLQEGRPLEAYDQDAINYVCRDRILKLEKKWNFQQVWPEIFNWHPSQAAFRENACLAKDETFVFSGSGILHFVCGEKPWQYPERELSEYFWAYARDSIFYEMLVVGQRLSPPPPPKPAPGLSRAVTCLREHGLVYTLKRALVKVKKWRKY